VSRNPVDVFRVGAAAHDRMFWLDGGGSREWSGRRSLIGFLSDDDVSLTFDADERVVRRHASGRTEVVGEDVFEALGREVAHDAGDPAVSWVGYFGYACRADLPARVAPAGAARVPDAVWMRVRDPQIFHHPPELSGGGRAIAPAPPDNSVGEWYVGAFDEVQRQLRLGNSYEVNLTYRESFTSDTDPVSAYLRLREVNPAPYSGYLQHNGVHVLSSSPERFATIDRHRWVETKPMKGTTPRGATEKEDEEHRAALTHDKRYRAENLMIVDLLRNDLSMVCEPGTVTVPMLMEVESYASVHQLVSTIRGHLRDDVSTLAALRALFPAGSMTGAPKLRTMQIIADVESTPRGVYSGGFGWISADGRADLGVVIRTLVATEDATEHGSGFRYELGTGGGITVHLDAASELAETTWKSQRLRSAVPS
jgi:para-aminobenzoate synthetase